MLNKCPKCKDVMEYRAIYVFGDSNLGIEHDWLECPSCGQKMERSANDYKRWEVVKPLRIF